MRMFDWLRSPRTIALREIAKRTANIEKMIKDGFEAEQIEDAMEKLDRIEAYLKLEETTAAPQGILPQYLPMWNAIPQQYRGTADTAVKFVAGVTLTEALSDPTGKKLQTVIEKAGPWIQRIGGLDALKGFLPKELLNKPAPGPVQPGTQSDPYYKPPD